MNLFNALKEVLPENIKSKVNKLLWMFLTESRLLRSYGLPPSAVETAKGSRIRKGISFKLPLLYRKKETFTRKMNQSSKGRLSDRLLK